MTRLPIWMLAFVVTGCFSKAPDDDDDDWGDESSEERWGGGGAPDPFGGEDSDGGTGSDEELPGTTDGGATDGGTTGGVSEGDDPEDGGVEDGDTDVDCEVRSVEPVYPLTDGGNFFYRANVEFQFDGIDDAATVQIVGESDGVIAGTTEWRGRTLWFAPEGGLQPSSYYTATLEHCAGSVDVSFRTTSLGEPLDVDVVGKTYAIDFGSARWVEPAGVGSLLSSLIDENMLLLGVIEASEREIDFLGAQSEEDSVDQDYCTPTFGFPEASDFSDSPFFRSAPRDTTLSVGGSEFNMKNLAFSGAFASDASIIGGMVLAGALDARDLMGTLESGGLLSGDDPSEVCSLISSFGVECKPCTDGDEYCIDVYLDQVEAYETGETLMRIDECNPEVCVDCDDAGSSCTAVSPPSSRLLLIISVAGLLYRRRRHGE